MLGRGQIEVRRLHWTPGGLECTVRSGKTQTVLVDVPAGITSVSAEGKRARVSRGKSADPCKLTLPAGVDVTVKISYGP